MSAPRSATSLVIIVLPLCVFVFNGCRSHGIVEQSHVAEAPATRQIETADAPVPYSDVAMGLTEPLTIQTQHEPEEWLLPLEEVTQITLSNSDVIRDIGGRVVNAPQGASTVYDPALQEIDPRTGVEAALSDFDARVASNVTFGRDERAFNNAFFGGGATSLHSNTGNFDLEVSKQSAAGSRFAVRNLTTYDRNSSSANLFPGAYNTAMEAEFTHPLLRGNGVALNRIAGPNATAGNYNGVVLARIRTDIALADFESSVRNLMLDVENAYWQLYFAYRTLDARKAAYEAALASWRNVQNGVDVGTADAEEEALARANYYQAKAALSNSLSGSAGGTGVLGVIGVYSTERNLRQLMGIAANDGRLIRPADEPSSAESIFDWQESLKLSLDRRVELRRQRWVLKQRENELVASKNMLLSQLDMFGLYRWRGFGDGLLGDRDVLNGSAFGDLYTGDLQGWQLGLRYSATIGKRREHAAVRAAELQLAREKAVLRNQELTITNNLSGQFAELARTYEVAQDNFNVSVAQRRRLETATAKYEEGEELLVFVLEAQRNEADADSQFFRSLMDYNMAIANLHYARGTYLDYMGVQLAEGPWSPESYRSYNKEFRRFKPRMNYCMMDPRPVSSGSHPQSSLGALFDVKSSEMQPSEAEVSDPQPSEAQPSEPQPSEPQPSKPQPSKVQVSETQPSVEADNVPLSQPVVDEEHIRITRLHTFRD